MATKDRAVAEKVAAKMWEQIQKKSPKLAAKILTDSRPRAKDHWHAQICSERKHRFLGSFKTQAEAEAAYVKELEKVWGYPPGYNVQCMPKIDKVWPIWTEEKARFFNIGLSSRRSLCTSRCQYIPQRILDIFE